MKNDLLYVGIFSHSSLESISHFTNEKKTAQQLN
jgi:hypothetical protein